MPDSEAIESISIEESQENDKKETLIAKLKHKLASISILLRQLPAKFIKRNNIDNDDVTDEQSEVSSEPSPDPIEDHISEGQSAKVNWKQKYRVAIYTTALTLSGLVGAGISYGLLSAYLRYQNNQVHRLLKEAEVSENKIEQYQAEVESLKAKLEEKEKQLLSGNHSYGSGKNSKKNITGNCVLNPDNISAFKECLEDFNKKQQ